MSVLMAPFADDFDPRDDVDFDLDLDADPNTLPEIDRDDYPDDDFYGDYPDYADYEPFGNE